MTHRIWRKCDGVSLQRLSRLKTAAFVLGVLSLGSLALGKASCHVLRTFRQSFGRTHVHCEELRSPANSRVCEGCQKWLFQPQSELPMVCKFAALQETMSRNCPAKLIINVQCFKPLHCGAVCYVVVHN